MRLPRDGQEVVHWPVSSPDDLSGASWAVDLDGEWHPAAYSGGRVSLLLCGPDRVPTDGAVQVPRSVRARVRCSIPPEVIIRDGGWIEVG